MCCFDKFYQVSLPDGGSWPKHIINVLIILNCNTLGKTTSLSTNTVLIYVIIH